MRKNNNGFISDARCVHGDKYDYSKVEYINANTKVCIICPEHGEFWQTPHSHLNGRGCPLCAKEHSTNYKNTKEFFIDRATKKHNGKYDYSKVEYVNSSVPVCIICPDHGEFWQTPHNHLNSTGCKKCKSNKHLGVKDSLESFIEKAHKIHGDKYDYSKVEYVNSTTPVCIICPDHGEFWQTPSSHLQNRGCNRCSKKMYDTESFIDIAHKIHGDKYDYSKVEYVNSTTPVCIICPEHGEFWQTPSNHTNKIHPKGCDKCNRLKHSNDEKISKEEFIERARKIHSDKYDYSKVEYVNFHTKICIICPEHGEFWQTPSHHLRNEGCPICNFSKLELDIENFCKNNNIKYISQYNPNWAKKYRYDFYLPDYNTIIECQGIQHYKPVDFAGKGDDWAKKLFEKNVKTDKIKYELAVKNNCNILYYTSDDLKTNDEITSLKELLLKIKYNKII